MQADMRRLHHGSGGLKLGNLGISLVILVVSRALPCILFFS